MYQKFPLLVIPFIVFAALAVLEVPGAGGLIWHEAEIVKLPLYSGKDWSVTGGDIFLFLSMGLLFVEIVRSTKTDAASIVNHLLSFMLFIVVLLCFILAPGFGNSTFFLFMMMTLLDPMAGFVVTTKASQRDLNVGAAEKRALFG